MRARALFPLAALGLALPSSAIAAPAPAPDPPPALAEPEAVGAVAVPAAGVTLSIDDGRLLTLGRHVLEQGGDGPRLCLSWPGAGIVFNFVGTSAQIHLADVDERAPGLAASWRSYWSVRVDRAPERLVAAPEGGGLVVLADALPPGPHTLRMVKRTEAMVGTSCLGSLKLSPGGRLLSPPPRPSRRVEVAGASNETGYGILGRPGCTGFQADEQDQGRAWPQLLADRVGAELVNTAYSGKGLVRNHPAAGDPALTLPRLWGRALAGHGTPTWDFAGHRADAVVIDLGGNDWSGFAGMPDPVAFEAAYGDFLAQVRLSHPRAWIFVTLNGSFTPPERGIQEGMLRRVVARRRAVGDARLSFFAFAQDRTPADRRACDGHPSPAAHRRMADELARELTRTLGWGLPTASGR